MSSADQWAQIQEVPEILRVAHQLVDVLEHLHDRGIVHCDLKPSNVLVDRQGEVKPFPFQMMVNSEKMEAAVRWVNTDLGLMPAGQISGAIEESSGGRNQMRVQSLEFRVQGSGLRDTA